MPKYLDMPEGNGESGAYQEFVAQIARGRAVAVVRVLDKSGGYSCYINSGDPTTKLTEANRLQHAIALTIYTRRRAESEGNHPDTGYTTELA
jgi:hypothetical protein